MSVRSVCHKFFEKSLAAFHKTRMKALLDCAYALTHHAQLTLTSLGRHLPGDGYVKHKIKRVDRLLGNALLYHEHLDIYQAVSQSIIRTLPRLVIVVDWSGCCNDVYHQLRASLVFQGRSLPLINYVVKKDQYNNDELHQKFLQLLAQIIDSNKPTYIITDAGFKTPWFQGVAALGWQFIGRVRGRIHGQLEGGSWGPIRRFFNQATSTARCLGRGLLGKTAKKPSTVFLHLVKAKSKGRHKVKGKNQSLYPEQEQRYKAMANELWLLVCSDESLTSCAVVKLYSKRMQIEQNFRDDKSLRFGFAWRHSRSQGVERLSILCLIAYLTTLILWLIGLETEQRGWQVRFQSNSLTDRQVLSFVRMAKELLWHNPQVVTISYLKSASKSFKKSYCECYK
jgi:hypothetical protein